MDGVEAVVVVRESSSIINSVDVAVDVVVDAAVDVAVEVVAACVWHVPQDAGQLLRIHGLEAHDITHTRSCSDSHNQ